MLHFPLILQCCCRSPGSPDSPVPLTPYPPVQDADKSRFFSSLTGLLDNCPQNVCQGKILPQLITAFEFGGAGSAILGPVFKIGKHLDTQEFQARIVPCIVKLFSSNDRNARSDATVEGALYFGHQVQTAEPNRTVCGASLQEHSERPGVPQGRGWLPGHGASHQVSSRSESID